MNKLFLYQLFTFALLLLGLGCQNNITYVNGVPFDTIDCHSFLEHIIDDGNDSVVYDDIVDTVQVIKLATTDESVFGDILDLVITDSNVYVLDFYGNVIIFSRNGNFISRLRRGQGPGEISNNPSCIAFNSETGYLYVFEHFKLNVYTSSGVFVYTKPLDYYCNAMLPIGDGFLILQDRSGNLSRKSFLISSDSSFAPIGVFQFFPDDYLLSSRRPLSSFQQNQVLISRPYDNNIYWFCNGGFSVRHRLELSNFERQVSNDMSVEQLRHFSDPSKFSFEGSFFENSNYQIFELTNNKFVYCVYRNTITNMVRCGRVYKSSDDTSGIPIHYACTMGVYNDYFYGILEPNPELFKRLRYNSHMSDSDVDKIKLSTPDDNPLIILYRLKDIPAEPDTE